MIDSNTNTLHLVKKMSKKSKRKAKAKARKMIEHQKEGSDVRNLAYIVCRYGLEKGIYQDGHSAEEVWQQFYADPLNQMYLKRKNKNIKQTLLENMHNYF